MNAITRNALRACGIEDPAVQCDAVRFARSLIGNRWNWPVDKDGKSQQIDFLSLDRTLESDEIELRIKAGVTALREETQEQKAAKVVGESNVKFMDDNGWEVDTRSGTVKWRKRASGGTLFTAVHRPKEPLFPWDLVSDVLTRKSYAALSTLVDSANRLVEHELFGGWQQGDTK